MPIYEYECPKCKARTERLERIQSPSEDAYPILICQCTDCDTKMERIISKEGGFILKGNWYKTTKTY